MSEATAEDRVSQKVPAHTIALVRRARLTWRDDEDLQHYVARWHDLVQRSPLGSQLELMRDEVKPDGLPDTHPRYDWGYGRHTESAKAARIGRALDEMVRRAPGSPRPVDVLWAFCGPTAVALDGLPGGRGRLFAVYPVLFADVRQRLVREAHRGRGVRDEDDRERVQLTAHEALRALYAQAAKAKLPELAGWRERHTQAEQALGRAIALWYAVQPRKERR